MPWEELIASGLEAALNEAYVVGLRQACADEAIDVLLHVSALPSTGPIDPDPRRVLRLHSPSRVEVLLRRDRTAAGGYGPALPLADLADVEAFFDGLSWADAMYGWKFFDDRSLIKDWPRELSLTLDLGPDGAAHTFYWFSECGRGTDDDTEAYCIEGTVSFDDLAVLRADGTQEPLEAFIANGRRWWAAMYDHDERLSVEAQQLSQHGTPKWRTWASGVTTVSDASTNRALLVEGLVGPEPGGLQQGSGDVGGQVAEAQGGPAEVFEPALIASVGALLVPDRLREARTSRQRRFSVRPRVMTSLSAASTSWPMESIGARRRVSPRPRRVLGP